MPDLFYSFALTLPEQIALLRKDILKYAVKVGYKKKILPIVYGTEKNVNNNILIVQPPFNDGRNDERNENKKIKILNKHFEEDECTYLCQILQEYEIYNYFITYAHLLPLERHTKNGIKDFGCWITKLVDILGSKLVVVLGEDAQLSFLKRKCILKDFHGKKIGEYNGAPLLLTYPFSYYLNRSSYEDKNYKEFILKTDWAMIQDAYKRKIKCQ